MGSKFWPKSGAPGILHHFGVGGEKVVVVDGGIMHSPVSDREAVQWVVKEGFLGRSPKELRETYEKLVRMAREGAGEEWDVILPRKLTSQFGYQDTPIGGRRFLSLVSPDSPESPSEEDMFSSDLGEKQLAATFGMVGTRKRLNGKLMVLIGGRDQSVPDWVDKKELLKRWEAATDCGGRSIWDRERSGIIPGGFACSER
ncbi:hypothetical protein N0V88_002338 [Collariella sp. IMI 366227]|nr:hypothetical protein N0V88_002338 [Collariella sp. IMI 366227]